MPGREGFVPHVRRPGLSERHPVHVTMRGVRACPNLRGQRVYRAIHAILARYAASARSFVCSVIEFSVQENHLHFVVEAMDERTLARGMQFVVSRIARAINWMLGRRGSLFRDRYHRRDLTSPRQLRNALVYVVMNVRKHASRAEHMFRATTLDPCSSAAWRDGWDSRAGPMLEAVRERLASAHLLDARPITP